MRTIPLTKGRVTLVDDDLYEYLNQWKWCYDTGYAARKTGKRVSGKLIHQTKFWMHREVIQAKKGEYVDHINGDKLDNQRSNLRICSQSVNMFNSKLHTNNKTGIVGVYWDKSRNKWKASIGVNRRRVELGRFNSIDDAIIVRKQAEKEYYARG